MTDECERTTISFTGDEICHVLTPLMIERINGRFPRERFPEPVSVRLVNVRWTMRPVEYVSKEPTPPGFAPMTVDVMFTLEWDNPEARKPASGEKQAER